MQGRRRVSEPYCCRGNRAVVCRISLVCLWWMLFTLCASAAYKNLSVKVLPAKNYASHQSQGIVTIAADPYDSEKKIRTAFDVKGLTKLGVVPINIIISNEGPDSLSVNGSTISLLDPHHRTFEAIPTKEVVEMVLRQRRRGGGRPTSLGGIPLPRSPIGKHAFEIETDFMRKSLKRRVRPRSTAWGFVFFQLPEREAALNGYKLYILNVENNKTKEKFLYFDVELK